MQMGGSNALYVPSRRPSPHPLSAFLAFQLSTVIAPSQSVLSQHESGTSAWGRLAPTIGVAQAQAEVLRTADTNMLPWPGQVRAHNLPCRRGKVSRLGTRFQKQQRSNLPTPHNHVRPGIILTRHWTPYRDLSSSVLGALFCPRLQLADNVLQRRLQRCHWKSLSCKPPTLHVTMVYLQSCTLLLLLVTHPAMSWMSRADQQPT